jgi:O-antigen/teichoic acid export membrane protein
VALTSSSLMVACMLAAYPLITHGGLSGALVLAVISVLGPGMCYVVLVGMQARHGGAHLAQDGDASALRREAWRRMRQSLPSTSTALLNTGTNWVCNIYLVHRLQGFEGVGMLAIALQWSTLMQLAFSSWGGKILHALSQAQEREGAAGLKLEMGRQVQRCVKVALASSVVIVLAGPAIALLYKVDMQTLTGLLLINAVAAVLSGANYVYERVFFMLESQRAWLGFSALAYAVQLGVTMATLPWSVMGVALGNALACAITLVTVRWHLGRTLSSQTAGVAG